MRSLLFVLLLPWCLVQSTNASPIEWDIYAVFGTPEQIITGTFDYDPASGKITAWDIPLVGGTVPGCPVQDPGDCDYFASIDSTGDAITFSSFGLVTPFNVGLGLQLASPLSNGAVHIDLVPGSGEFPPTGSEVVFGRILEPITQGFIEAVPTNAPEPSVISLLCIGSLFLTWRFRKLRCFAPLANLENSEVAKALSVSEDTFMRRLK